MKKERKHYVSNKKLYEEMILYNQKRLEAEALGKETPRASNYIGEAICLICTRLAYKPNFINYTFRDEMIADGIENCVRAIDSFNHEKSQNPFAYFTQIAYNAFIRRITSEKKQTYLKYKNLQNIMIDSYISDEDHAIVTIPSNEVSDLIIESFETKNRLTKEKKSVKKGLEKFINQNEEM
jgi:DNA-directed RNA polymerase specialized sigma24 family protein